MDILRAAFEESGDNAKRYELPSRSAPIRRRSNRGGYAVNPIRKPRKPRRSALHAVGSSSSVLSPIQPAQRIRQQIRKPPQVGDQCRDSLCGGSSFK